MGSVCQVDSSSKEYEVSKETCGAEASNEDFQSFSDHPLLKKRTFSQNDVMKRRRPTRQVSALVPNSRLLTVVQEDNEKLDQCPDGVDEELSCEAQPQDELDDSSSSSLEIDTDDVKLRILFDCLDQNKDGKISTTDLINHICEVSPRLSQGSTDAVEEELREFVSQLVNEYSPQKDGLWSLREFSNFMNDSAILAHSKSSTPQKKL